MQVPVEHLGWLRPGGASDKRNDRKQKKTEERDDDASIHNAGKARERHMGSGYQQCWATKIKWTEGTGDVQSIYTTVK